MVCDTQTLPGQTLSQRKDEVRRATEALSKGLAAGRIKVKLGPQGAVVFEGLSASERSRVSDGCLLRRVLVEGSALAKAKIAQAEQLAGRSINKQAVAQGVHSHDGGKSWHKH